MPSSACQKCALRSEEHTSELQSHSHLVCRLLLENKIGFTHTPLVVLAIGARSVFFFHLSHRAARARHRCRVALLLPRERRRVLAGQFFLRNGRPPKFPLFPYTTLFR